MVASVTTPKLTSGGGGPLGTADLSAVIAAAAAAGGGVGGSSTSSSVVTGIPVSGGMGANGNLTGAITTGNILASLGGLAGATSIKFSFTPTSADGTTASAVGNAQNPATITTQIPIAKVVTM